MDRRAKMAVHEASTRWLVCSVEELLLAVEQVEPEKIRQNLAEAGVPTDLISSNLEIHTDPYTAVENAHALATLTEWEEFKTLDLARIHQLMLKPAFVFDGRNVLCTSALKTHGFDAFVIGQPQVELDYTSTTCRWQHKAPMKL